MPANIVFRNLNSSRALNDTIKSDSSYKYKKTSTSISYEEPGSPSRYSIIKGDPPNCILNEISCEIPAHRATIDFNKFLDRPSVVSKELNDFEPIYGLPSVSSNNKHIPTWSLRKFLPRPEIFALRSITDISKSPTKEPIMPKLGYSNLINT